MPTPPSTEFVSPAPSFRAGAARIIGLGLLGLAITTSAYSLVFFPNSAQAASAWQLYFASLASLISSAYVLFPATVTRPRWSRALIGWAAITLCIAAFMRFYRLDSLPPGIWFDEADIGLKALRILNEPDYRPVIVDTTNPPAHIFYLVAFSFKLFGVNIVAFRGLMAMFGILAAVTAFLVGREAHGPRFGLIFAFLLAVSHWAVNFSRVGLPGMSAPFFVLLSILFVSRAWRTGRVHEFLWAGAATGFGLCFYAAYQPIVVTVAVMLAWWAIESWHNTGSQRRQRTIIAINFSAFALATGLVIAPVAQYAILNPDPYWARANEVSIFNYRDEPNLILAIVSNTVKHLLMFNYRGDNNGRHNLPGEPMLDPASGILFVLGLTLALSRPKDPTRAVFLITFPLTLASGILTVDYEAPQSLRAIGVLPVALYFATLAAETLWRALDRFLLGQHTARIAAQFTLTAALGGFILYHNFNTYFVRQAHDDAVWASYNSVETLTARRMLELDPEETTFYVSMYLDNHPAINFLAPQTVDSRAVVPPDILPIRESGERPVAIFIDQNLQWIVDEARRYYPNAEYTIDTTPAGNPALYTIRLSREDIESIQGLTIRYWRGDSTDSEPAFTHIEKTLEATWPDAAPLAMPFVAEWSGILYAPESGEYEIALRTPAEASLWLDDTAILNGTGEQRSPLSLAKGNHTLLVQARGGDGVIQLQWRRIIVNAETALATIPAHALYLSPPASNHGLLGEYFAGPNWQPPAQFSRIDPFIDMYFHVIPLERPYSVDWVGQIDIPIDGEYAFGLKVNGRAQVFIGDQLIVNAPEPSEYTEGRISLSVGRHKLQVRFIDEFGASEIRLYWTPPGKAEREVVPSTALWPSP